MTASFAITACNVHLPQLVSENSVNPQALKCVAFEVPDTSSGGGTFYVNLSTFGMANVYDIWVFEHSTKDDIIITPTSEFTSAVATGVLTVTYPSAVTSKKRVIIVWGL